MNHAGRLRAIQTKYSKVYPLCVFPVLFHSIQSYLYNTSNNRPQTMLIEIPAYENSLHP